MLTQAIELLMLTQAIEKVEALVLVCGDGSVRKTIAMQAQEPLTPQNQSNPAW